VLEKRIHTLSNQITVDNRRASQAIENVQGYRERHLREIRKLFDVDFLR
jgi:hypothetical protein